MVATIKAIQSSSGASKYFSREDDYYSKDTLDGSYSEWFGNGAKSLELEGKIDGSDLKNLLDGKVSDDQLGKKVEDKIVHSPGWDVTFQAPKSVSIAALVFDDKVAFDAHQNAVKTALTYLEKEILNTRIKTGGELEKHKTQSLVAALYTHETSRAQDAHLHTHSLIMNATQDMSGKWRSVESKPIYHAQKKLGMVYRMDLAQRLQKEGRAIVATGNEADFELKYIPKNLIEDHSKRSKQIEEKLAEISLDRSNATAAQKEIINLETREKKERVSRKQLRDRWKSEAKKYNFDLEKYLDTSEKLSNTEINELKTTTLSEVISSIQSMKSRFTEDDIVKKMSIFGVGLVSLPEIQTMIQQNNELIPTETKTFDAQGKAKTFVKVAGYTTKEAQEIEKSVIHKEWLGRGKFKDFFSDRSAKKIVKKAEKVSNDKGFNWTDSQKKATFQLLTNRDMVVGIQGYAGTAKTNTVVATFAAAMESNGYKVRGMAPTSSAAITLESAGIESPGTVHSFINSDDNSKEKEVWIVDEASLLGAKIMEKLISKAENSKARLVLVGDTKQHQSIEFGSMFQLMQDSGMTTYTLDEIVRQKMEAEREKVYGVIKGQLGSVLDKMDKDQQIFEDEHDVNRVGYIVDKYVGMDANDRENTLIIDPSREGKQKLTDEIQGRLAIENKIKNPVDTTNLKEKAKVRSGDGFELNITDIDKKFSFVYEKGEWVVFNRRHKSRGVERGEYYKVIDSDRESGIVKIQDNQGKMISFEPKKWGHNNKIYQEEKIRLYEGDLVSITKNNPQDKIYNGLSGRVVETNDSYIIFESKKGKHKVNFHEIDKKHFALSYVKTTVSAQGDTKQNAIYHIESNRVNLTNKAAFYVGLSRATDSTIVVTDNKDKALKSLKQNDGSNESAMNKDDLSKFNKELSSTIKNEINETKRADKEIIKNTYREHKVPALSL